MSILNHVKTFNKGSIGAGVSVPEIKIKDVDGNVRKVEMNGLPSKATDYSIQNLDKMGIAVSETDPSFFRPVTMDSSDSLMAAAEYVNSKLNSEKSE